MDALDRYKKAWDSQPAKEKELSKLDIYKMSHSRSSSIVKWIFIIGILELIFWAGLNIFFVGSSHADFYEKLHIENLILVSIYLHYFIVVLFLIAFYKSYKSISVFDNTKNLIKKILNTRKIVKYYVYFNLFYGAIANLLIFILIFSDMDILMEYYAENGIQIPENETAFKTAVIVTVLFVSSLMFILLWVFYRLLYGTLLKKLNKNYKELIKLEEI
ncbi:hypothetical protein [Tenacibaculum sp. SG-28]|uniref:hypothetical protein n=1 Tax=Tenacibaculum sp. SG-28 TaxID=754426 RepID=UPI000CF3BD86|nr:hypothetical protein [Tenacibaculum sp. SG-28]PQJ23497.1 hypothetical protein BSU00_04815 [Tenacibaculum sp. SG-28]